MKQENSPKTLQEALQFFSDPDRALAYFAARRWPNGVQCPTCGRRDARFLANQRKWQCKSVHPKRQFSAKVGTIMEDSALPLEKWMAAIWLLSSCKNGVSSHELARHLGITQKSAWFMLHRIRFAMQSRGGGKLGARVEVDETFIGGKARNMHANKRRALEALPGGERKTVVLGMLERGGSVRTHVIPNREAATLQPIVLANVRPGAKVITDEHAGYNGLEDTFLRGVVNHAIEYVNGSVHTNGMENFWSLFKRSVNGTYVCVEPFHLFRYLDEQAFRYNTRKDGKRKLNDGERFNAVLGRVAGRRLTYESLTGKEGETAF